VKVIFALRVVALASPVHSLLEILHSADEVDVGRLKPIIDVLAMTLLSRITPNARICEVESCHPRTAFQV
jgi:hypothetical protein